MIEKWNEFKAKPLQEGLRMIRIPVIAIIGFVLLGVVNQSDYVGWSSSILNNVTEATIGFALIWVGDRLFCHTRAHKLKEAAYKEGASTDEWNAYRDRERARLLMVGLMLLGVFASAG